MKTQSPEWTYMQTPQFTFSDLPLEPEQKEGEIDYSDAKVRCQSYHHHHQHRY
jgi:hypothetical protein